MAGAAKKTASGLGRLSALGPKQPWQIALYLPEGWDDLRAPLTDFTHLPREELCVLRGRLDGSPTQRWDRTPRLSAYLADARGLSVGFTVFGDTREFAQALESCRDDLCLLGRISHLDGRVWLKSLQIITARWLGRLRPRYRSKTSVIAPETVRERILPLLGEALPLAARFLVDAFADVATEAQLLTCWAPAPQALRRC